MICCLQEALSERQLSADSGAALKATPTNEDQYRRTGRAAGDARICAQTVANIFGVCVLLL